MGSVGSKEQRARSAEGNALIENRAEVAACTAAPPMPEPSHPDAKWWTEQDWSEFDAWVLIAFPPVTEPRAVATGSKGRR